MSFILDAVKKSEERRRDNQKETLQSWYHDAHLQPKNEDKKNGLVYILIAFNLVLIGGVALLVYQTYFSQQSALDTNESPLESKRSQLENTESKSPDSENVEHMVSEQNASTSKVFDNEPRAQRTDKAIVANSQEPQGIISTQRNPSSKASNQVKTMRSDDNIPMIEDLPESLVIHVPALSFSSHLYSNMPKARQVIVNGVRLKEGEYLERNLQLIEINEKDLVFEIDNEPFRILLSRYWSGSE